MHHLATLPVFFAAAFLAIIFGIGAQAAFVRAGFNTVKKFVDAPFHGFGPVPLGNDVVRAWEEDKAKAKEEPAPRFAPTLVLGGLCALASLVTVISGLANLLVFFKNVT